MSKTKVDASDAPSSGADWRGLKLFLNAEVGYRSLRDGFPAATALTLGAESIERRRQFLTELTSAESADRKYSQIRGLQVSRQEYAEFGAIALDYVTALSEARGGVCPAFNELAANLAHDPRIGHVNSRNFETTMRVLLSAYFSKERYGPPLWSGSVENLYHAVTFRFPDDHGRFAGKNIPGALLTIINEVPQVLFNTRELTQELGIANDSDACTMVDRGLQLLLHSGDIVQHPHHVTEPGSNVTCCVWSSKRGPWVKPPLLSPLLQVLHLAARPEGGFLKELWAAEWPHVRFSHKAINPAAQVLQGLNLIQLDTRPERVAVQGGKRGRECRHVTLTDAAREMVSAWSGIRVGQSIDPEVYNPLRRLLVTRRPLASPATE
jgi:hypothetical protein